MVFEKYATYYDLYYSEKNYAAESKLVMQLAGRYTNTIQTLLDMGCGTGRHIQEFLNQDIDCDGFDFSERMLKKAQENLLGKEVKLEVGNIINFENKKIYDVVVSLFAVMSYLISNDDLKAGFRTARKHLRKDGVFIFDTWFGPAVLSTKPEKRIHEYCSGRSKIVREATPTLDPIKQVTSIRYRITEQIDQKIINESIEVHILRIMFVQELKMMLEDSNFKLVHFCPTNQIDGTVTIDTWNVTFVAVAV